MAAALSIVACSKAEIDPLEAGQAALDQMAVEQSAALNGAASTPAMLPEMNETSQKGYVRPSLEDSVFREDYESVLEAGAMVIKLDPAEFDYSGVTGTLSGDKALIFYDPSCQDCMDLSALLKSKSIEHIFAPVAFYSEDGLNVVSALACKSEGLEDASEACERFSRGILNNTKTLMLHGIVDVPALMLPNGWLIENLGHELSLDALLKGRADG